MRGATLITVAILVALSGCGYPKFRGTIGITQDKSSLRVTGAFSPDGGRFASAESKLGGPGQETSTLRVWRRGPTPDLPGAWRLAARVKLTDLFVVDLAFSPDSGTIALAGLGRRANILLWDVRARRIAAILDGGAPMIQAVAFGPRGDWLASAGIDGRIQVWDLRSGRRRARVEEAADLIQQSRFPLAVAPDGAWIAYGRIDGQVAFADPRTGRRIALRPSGGREIYDIAPSPDGKWLAVAADSGVRLWDLAHPEAPVDLSRDQAPAIAFFPDSRTLLTGGRRPQHSQVREVPSGRVVYGFLTAAARVGNRALGAGAVTPDVVGPEEERLWRRLHHTFPLRGAEEAVRSLVLDYHRSPSIHRVAVSPENLWVVFFEGGRASLVITQRHYEMRLTGAAAAPQAPPPVPAKPSPRAIEKSL